MTDLTTADAGIRFIDPPHLNPRVLAYELTGNFTGDDMRVFIERLEKIASGGQKALLYQDMSQEWSFDFETIKVKLQNMGTLWRDVERIAIVGDARWLDIYIGIVDHLTPQDMKYFDQSAKDEAFAWLTG